MTGYTDVMFTQPVIPEAAASTQDIYALLFPVVQAVLTDQNADIDALLADGEHAGAGPDRPGRLTRRRCPAGVRVPGRAPRDRPTHVRRHAPREGPR